MTIQEAENKAMAYCQKHRETLKLMPVIRRVLAGFDGKVYNKRFLTALNSAAEDMQGTDRPALYFTAEKSMSGNRVFIYGHIRMDYQTQPILCVLDLKDGRIDSAQGLQSCRERYEEITKECGQIENTLHEMPELIAQLDKLHEMQSAIEKRIPRHLYYDYDIKHIMEYGAVWVFPEMKKPTDQAG